MRTWILALLLVACAPKPDPMPLRLERQTLAFEQAIELICSTRGDLEYAVDLLQKAIVEPSHENPVRAQVLDIRHDIRTMHFTTLNWCWDLYNDPKHRRYRRCIENWSEVSEARRLE